MLLTNRSRILSRLPGILCRFTLIVLVLLWCLSRIVSLGVRGDRSKTDSIFVRDRWSFSSEYGRLVIIDTRVFMRTDLGVQYAKQQWPDNSQWEIVREPYDHLILPSFGFSRFGPERSGWDFIGISCSVTRPAHGLGFEDARDTVVIIEYWFPILLLTLLLAARWFLSRRRRTIENVCSRCGYDLRASPLRCPECGCYVGVKTNSRVVTPCDTKPLVFLILLLSTPHFAGAQSLLSNLPSKESDHLQKLKNLPDNTWLDLGPPAPDPKFGKARGRAWGARMPCAQDLRGAFLFGEGVHGYVKPDGHYMDDLWFYDLNANQWLCVYPGADTKTLNLKINKDGFESDDAGHAIPVAQLVHAYENLTYDSDLHRFLFMPCPGDYWKKPLLPLRSKWLKDAPKITTASPFFYDAKAGHFDRFKTESKSPPSGFGDVLMYIPSLKKTFFWHHDGIWFYDAATNDWTDAKPAGEKGKFPPFGIDPTAALDTKRNLIYIGGGSYPVVPPDQNALWIYDLNTNAWRDPNPKNIPGCNSYNTNISVMEYDTKNDKLVLFRHSAGDQGKHPTGIFIYDPEKNEWSTDPLPLPQWRGQCKNAFYAPDLNIYIFHSANDSTDDGSIWAYRYRQN